MIEIIIADDHQLFVNGLQLLLSTEIDLHISAVASDGKELLHLLGKQHADLVLLDINMPGLNGLDALQHISRLPTPPRVIILSTYNEAHLMEKARQLGANGYLLKTSNKEQLLQTVHAVMQGQSCFGTMPTPTASTFSANDNFLKRFNLTPRESEMIQLLKEGLTNQQMADKLYLSIYTVETHRKNIMQKLGLKTPAALMKYILENNL